MSISKLHYGSLSLRPAVLFTLLTDRTAFAHSPRGFLLPGSRRFGHPLRPRLSLQWQLGNFHRRDFQPREWQLASLHAKAGHNYKHLRWTRLRVRLSRKERRMKFANATNLNRKSGGAKRADLRCAIRVPRSYRPATATNHHRILMKTCPVPITECEYHPSPFPP